MTLWLSLAVMGVLAIMFVAWPLYSRSRTFTPVIAISVLIIAAISAGLYHEMGSPDLQSGVGEGELANMDEAVAALAARLESDPHDLEGWKMLGRSYMSLGNYALAVDAFEKAVELESSQNAQTLVELASAMLSTNSGGVAGPVAALFESALALEPNNPQALFYGGIAAINRDDKELAANRWEMLLGLNPPDEIREVLRQRVAQWRGESTPPEQQSVASQPAQPAGQVQSPVKADMVIQASISLSETAAAAVPGDATVFIIARDPAQPAPPIAVIRRRAAELPTVVELGDSDSMIAGRLISGFAELELIARVSLSGQPAQQPGDWVGSAIVKPADNNSIILPIDTEIR